jgi:hypothetical protein
MMKNSEMLSNSKSNSIKPNYHIKLICVAALISVLIYFRDINGISFNKFILVLIAGAAFVILNESEAVALIAYLIPLFSGLPGNYILGFASIIILFKRGNNIVLSKAVLAPIIILLMELVHLFTPPSTLGEFYIYSVYIIALTLLLLDKKVIYDNELIIFSYSLVVVFAMTEILINTMNNLTLANIMQYGVRIGNLTNVIGNLKGSTMILSNDQNMLGYYCAISISALLVISYKKVSSYVITIPIIAITTFYGILSMSRAFIIVIGIILTIYIGNSLRDSWKGIKNILMLFIIIAIVAICVNIFFPQVIEMIATRFNSSDITGGRGAILGEYDNFILSSVWSLFFGSGLQNMNIKANLASAPHNAIQQTIVAYGVFGFFIVAWWLGAMYKNSRRGTPKKINLVFLLPCFTLCMYLQSLQFLSPYTLMLPMIIVFCSIQLANERI